MSRQVINPTMVYHLVVQVMLTYPEGKSPLLPDHSLKNEQERLIYSYKNVIGAVSAPIISQLCACLCECSKWERELF